MGMLTVFVIARDWNLRASVRAELRERGIEALGMETFDDAGEALAAGQAPAAVVFEPGAEGSGAAALRLLAKRVPVVVVASRSDPVEIAAAAILYRPVRVGDVVTRVIEILQGRPA